MTQAMVKAEAYDVFQLGRVLASTNYFKDARDEAQAVAKILAGQELGFGPIASLTNIHIIEGKPSMGANLIAAAIKKSGRYNFRVREMSDTGCVLEFYELMNGKMEPVGVSEFTAANARAAGLFGKGNWSKFPRNMFFARALTNGARWYCSDVFVTGAYTPEELNPDIEVTEDGEPLASHYRPQTTDQTPGSELADILEDAPAAPAPRQLADAATTAAEVRQSMTDDPMGNGAAVPPPTITMPQAKRLFALAHESGWSDEAMRFFLHAEYGIASSKEIRRTDYDEICTRITDPTLAVEIAERAALAATNAEAE